MKIDLGGGAYLEADEGPRDSRFHMHIMGIEPIPNTRGGNWLILSCGHQVMTFGKLEHAGGAILCTECRDREKK